MCKPMRVHYPGAIWARALRLKVVCAGSLSAKWRNTLFTKRRFALREAASEPTTRYALEVPKMKPFYGFDF